MTATKFVREHQLTELLKDLDGAADTVAGMLDLESDQMPRDTLHEVVAAIEAAATFIHETILEIGDGR
jgi:hypothetical protein